MQSEGRWGYLVALAALLILLPSSGCDDVGGDTDFSPGEALRAQFRERAAHVLDDGEEVVVTSDGFLLGTAAGNDGAGTATDGLRLTLPRMGEGAFRIEAADFEVRVREIGASGEGVVTGRAVAYPRQGGTSFWTSNEDGVEEWLSLREGIADGRAAVAAWEIEGAAARASGDIVELLDDQGRARLRVKAPSAYEESGRSVPVRLEASGARIELFVDAGGKAVLVDPAWGKTGSLAVPRTQGTSVLLPSGKVLVAGGRNTNGGPCTATAEIFDPSSNTWTFSAPMSYERVNHTGTWLPAYGKFLVTGGFDSANVSLNTVEWYDPATELWSPRASMSTGRGGHTATLLVDGRVFVAGGYQLNTAEIYNPATNTWTSVAPMAAARYLATATRLASGKVLVVAGRGVSTASLYDAVANTWSPVGDLSDTREGHTATLLSNGKVMVAGGYSLGPVDLVELYDPSSNTWTLGPHLATPRNWHTATVMNGGEVWVVGGANQAGFLLSVEIYHPASGTWSDGPPVNYPHFLHTSTPLFGNKLLVAAGSTTISEIYDPGALSANGIACNAAAQCTSGFCVDGVCCDTACNAGPCDACSIPAGASVKGQCKLLSGPVCNDGNACTESDTCLNGVCGGTAMVCPPAPDACHQAGTCNVVNGACSYVAKPNGTACDDGNACTVSDACTAGTCKGAAVVCQPVDSCHDAGTCDPATGLCSHPPKADDTACDDGNGCTQTDLCEMGVCTGMDPVVCMPADMCHDAGTCDPVTGACSNPPKPDDTPCTDGTECTMNDTCQNGTCQSGEVVVCPPLDACHGDGVCSPATGICGYPTKPDDTPCDDGNACTKKDSCNAGVCVGRDYLVCAADGCREGGACDEATGTCPGAPKADGTSCPGGTCSDGVCAPDADSEDSSGASGCECGVIASPLHRATGAPIGLLLGLSLLLRRSLRARRCENGRQKRCGGP